MRVVLCGRSCRVLRAVYDDSLIGQAFGGLGWRRQDYGTGWRITSAYIAGPRAMAIGMLLIYAAAHYPDIPNAHSRRDCYKAREEAERILHDLGL